MWQYVVFMLGFVIPFMESQYLSSTYTMTVRYTFIIIMICFCLIWFRWDWLKPSRKWYLDIVLSAPKCLIEICDCQFLSKKSVSLIGYNITMINWKFSSNHKNRYFDIIVDTIDMYSFKQSLNDHCFVRKLLFEKNLQGKILLSNGMHYIKKRIRKR